VREDIRTDKWVESRQSQRNETRSDGGRPEGRVVGGVRAKIRLHSRHDISGGLSNWLLLAGNGVPLRCFPSHRLLISPSNFRLILWAFIAKQ